VYTHLGRLIAIIACILGTAVLSLMVVALDNYISHNSNEESAYKDIQTYKFRQTTLKPLAATLIGRYFKLYIARKKKERSRLSLIYNYFRIYWKFKMAMMKSAGDPIFSEVIESLDNKCKEVFAKPLIEDVEEVKDYKRQMTELENCSMDLNDAAANLKSLSIRMLNVGYAMRHCKVRKVDNIYSISDVSILLKLLEKQGLIPSNEVASNNPSGNSTLNSSYYKLKRKSEKVSEIPSPLLQAMLARYKEQGSKIQRDGLITEDY
jgi:hypothetical protein